MRGAEVSRCVRYAVPLERLFALAGHIGARGLVYLGLHAPFPVAPGWMALAVLMFATIDGTAVYGHLQHWKIGSIQ